MKALQPVCNIILIPQRGAHCSSAYTPWIAMIPCDANATDASKEVDVFTLARDKGAKAAVSIYFLMRAKSSCPRRASYSILRTL